MKDETSTSVETTTKGSEPSEAEAKAREQGWLPKEEFQGKSDSWTDADEYLKRGDPKYLRERLRTVEKGALTAKQELARQLAEQDAVFKDRLDRMGKASARALELQRDRIYADFEAKKEAAVEDGDVTKYKAIQAQEAKAREKFAEEDAELAEKPAPKPGAKVEGHDDLIADWWANHPDHWLDERKAKFVGLLYEQAEKKGLKTVADRLEYVDKALAKAEGKNGSSEEESEPEARMPSVEKGARVANGPRKKGWSDIPAEERSIYTKHIKEKLYKDQAEAASVHWGE